MIEFVLAGGLVLVGVLFIAYPRPLGVAFCRFGKAIWSIGTLGLTDMGWFYSEEKAPKTFRILGVMCLLFSIPWFTIGYLSISGPGAFAAMRESRSYLSARYGTAGNWRLSAKSLTSNNGDYLVTYSYGERTGVLRASWIAGHYVFAEEK